jgi:hypothetical protein
MNKRSETGYLLMASGIIIYRDEGRGTGASSGLDPDHPSPSNYDWFKPRVCTTLSLIWRGIATHVKHVVFSLLLQIHERHFAGMGSHAHFDTGISR